MEIKITNSKMTVGGKTYIDTYNDIIILKNKEQTFVTNSHKVASLIKE